MQATSKRAVAPAAWAAASVIAIMAATASARAAQLEESPGHTTARAVANVEFAFGVYRSRSESLADLDGEIGQGPRRVVAEGAASDDGRARIEAVLADLEPHLHAARRMADAYEQAEATAAQAALDELVPLLGDLSLPEDSRLWLLAGELANKARDEQLAALAAAMVCRTHDLEGDGRALRVVMDSLTLVRPSDIREAAREREAIVSLYESAIGGDARAMGEVGTRYASSAGVPRDREHAMQWWRRGAEAGDGQSMWYIGLAYDRGNPDEGDHDAARRWYERAVAAYRQGARAGDAEAMYNLGVMHNNGWGVPEDDAAALEWFTRAAEAGSAWAMHTLAMGQYNGQFEGMTAREAAEWDRKAADTGFVVAIDTMAWRYLEGHGVERDEAKAMAWYRKAARLGSEHARDELERRGLGW